MPEPAPLSRQHPLHCRNLRHAALHVLDTYGPASISQILDVLWANGFRLTGDRTTIGKRLSDALRHETKQGRARRVGWGVYAIGHLTKATRWRIHQRWTNATPATLDQEGEPMLDGRNPTEPVAAVPWSRHDRHGDPIFWNVGRERWKIGQKVRTIIRARRKAARLATKAAADRRHPPTPRRRGWPPLAPAPTRLTRRARTLTTPLHHFSAARH